MPDTPEKTDTAQTRCGFISLIGAPNAGKSTLLNRIVGTKVSIVTPKVQTTRHRVLGIVMKDDVQVIFIDTPGIFSPKRRLDRAMVSAAWAGARESDIVALLVDVSRKQPDTDVDTIVAGLQDSGRKAVLLLNKIDRIKREKLLEISARLNDSGVFTDTFMISALKGDGVKDFVETLAARLPEGPFMYPEDQVSDMPMRLMAAEITREKLFMQLQQELPYSCAVETELWEERKKGGVDIGQVIYVSRAAHKGIVLGKGGSRIKTIGTAARKELEEILERKVNLKLFVKVREKWIDDPERYREMGLDFNA